MSNLKRHLKNTSSGRTLALRVEQNDLDVVEKIRSEVELLERAESDESFALRHSAEIQKAVERLRSLGLLRRPAPADPVEEA